MYILIEGHQYEASKVKDVLYGIDALENVEGMVIVNYVGYFYNKKLNDCVCILPKVLLNMDEKVFDNYPPEAIINLCSSKRNYQEEESNETLLEENVLKEAKKFIYEFAIWIYRTILVFKKNNPKSDIIYQKKITQAGKGRRRQTDTFLDIVLALIQFNKDNQNFFFFTLRNLHSGYNKINWTRTISTTSAIVQNNRPIYLNPINKRRRINFDEELLVIFFSILNYINDYYGFEAQINCNFNLITGKQFEMYIKRLGRVRLMQIKYKYFSDKALELWELCYAFFEHAHQVRINNYQNEYLLVKNFNIVFEDIIDELIGDKELPDGMKKEQEDGKIVDHLFTARSLIDNEDKFTYYIGDSKYYKIGHVLGKESIYKQYTYARNVIQWNIDIFNAGKTPSSGIKLRDDKLTEGYNIIPNFFISAKMDKTFDYSDDGIERTDRKNNKHPQYHFKNRLFDRDTLLLFHYDVNFLFVVSLYARNNSLQKSAWKEKMRAIFCKEIQDWLQEEEYGFEFYAMQPKHDVDAEAYIKEHFRDVIGKVYTPYTDNNIISLALAKDDEFKQENEALKKELGNYFDIVECKLGENPKEKLPNVSNVVHVDKVRNKKGLALCVVKEGADFKLTVKEILQYAKIGIALQNDKTALKLVEGFTNAKYLIILNKSGCYNAFYMKDNGPILVKGTDDLKMASTMEKADLYLVYDVILDPRPMFEKLDLSSLINREDIHSPCLIYINQLLPNKKF